MERLGPASCLSSVTRKEKSRAFTLPLSSVRGGGSRAAAVEPVDAVGIASVVSVDAGAQEAVASAALAAAAIGAPPATAAAIAAGAIMPLSIMPPAPSIMGEGAMVQKSGYKSSLCKNFMEGGECSYGPKCNFAHGPMEIRSAGSQPMMPAGSQGVTPGGMNPMFKTSMCHNMTNEGNCIRGMMCKFAHSTNELRGQGGYPAGAQGGSTPMGTPNVMIQGSDGKIKYKTSMCTVFMEQGFCPRGEACGFAHSAKQLLEAQARDPKYKTAICEAWKSNGTCDRGSNCIYAHGQSDLRQKSQMSMPPMTNMTTAYPPQYGGGHQATPMHSQQQMQNPRFKTSMCIAFAKNGYCIKMAACQYAHGPQELRNGGGPPMVPPPSGMMGGMDKNGSGNYKTAMCKNVLEKGHCTHGDNCHYAHSSAELRSKMAMPGGGMMAGMGPGAQNMFKRKQMGLVKTVLCTNYSSYGECQFGDNCNFAHGPEELASNKKQRF